MLEPKISRRGVVRGAGALALGAVVGAGSAGSRGARAQAAGNAGEVTTSDGVTLRYLEAGSGWRDPVPRIELPSLVVGGRVSTVPWRSQAWVAEQIPGARLEIFEKEEGGNHFMFTEGYDKVNCIVADFVG